MNEIEGNGIRRWLVGQLTGVYRLRNNNEVNEWGKGYFSGKEIILSQIAVRLFGSEVAVDIANKAEKEAGY
jgi:hypothetical protein